MKDHESDTARDVRVSGTISSLAVSIRRATGSFLLTVFILAFAILLTGRLARAENLPMFRGNTAHTGVYDAAGVPSLWHVKWTFHAEGQLISSPAVSGDVVYVGSTAGFLYAVDRAIGHIEIIRAERTKLGLVCADLVYPGNVAVD
jgi:hypothetical protein